MAGQVDEDSYLKVRDENAQLKKLLHQQGEKQKIMATKIMKMTTDVRRNDGGLTAPKEVRAELEVANSELAHQNEVSFF